MSDTLSAEQLIARCAERIARPYHLATNAGAELHCIRLSGKHARELLQMGTSVDLDERVFVPPLGVRCRFARVAAVIRPVSANEFRLYVDRSLADFVCGWLRFAATDPGFEEA